MWADLKCQGLIDPDIFIARTNELAEQIRSVKQKKERLLIESADGTLARTKALIAALEAGPDDLAASMRSCSMSWSRKSSWTATNRSASA